MKLSAAPTFVVLACVFLTGLGTSLTNEIVDSVNLTHNNGDVVRRDPFDYPWSVALLFRKNGSLLRKCGGVRLSEKYLVTAADCVNKANYPVGTTIHIAHATVSDNKQDRDWIISDMSFQSAIIFLHHKYEPKAGMNNIAVVMPYRLFEFKSSPSLPALSELNNLYINENATVLTWVNVTSRGDTEDRMVMHAIRTKIMRKSVCKIYYPNINQDIYICAYNYGERKNNEEDLGTPLVVKGADSKPVLVGIGFPMTPQYNTSDSPMVFTRVSLYSEWIHYISAKEVPVQP